MPKTVRAAWYAPDGTEVTTTTPPNKWDVAGIAQRIGTGRWVELAHGGSHDSVRRRTLTYANRSGSYHYTSIRTVRIYEATAPVVREYFGHHKVSIVQVFKPGQGGWQQVNLHGGWSNIRKLSKQGVTSVAFEGTRNGVRSGPADFEMSSLLKSMRLPRQRMCETKGHEHLPATHKISYAYKADAGPTTEFVCPACLDIMREPVSQELMTSFTYIPLAA